MFILLLNWPEDRCNPEVVGSSPTEVKFSLARGDFQISFKGVITKGDLVYPQYCVLRAPKHVLKKLSFPISRVLHGSHTIYL